MRLAGTMRIELTDVNTGEVETVAEENMVTNAVNHILGLNPMGVFYEAGDSIDGIEWNGSLLPICPNMIGGILLFSQTLGEDVENIYSMSGNLPVAYPYNYKSYKQKGTSFYSRRSFFLCYSICICLLLVLL